MNVYSVYSVMAGDKTRFVYNDASVTNVYDYKTVFCRLS